MRKFVLAVATFVVAALFIAASALADDDFNRPDGKLAVRDPVTTRYGPWVPLNASNTSILSNQVVPDGHNPDGTGTLDGAIWQEQYQVGSPPVDQSWYFTLRKSNGTPTGYHWTVLARGATANPTTGQSLYSGYDVRIFNDGTFQLFRTDANVLNWQDQATVAPPNDGDAIGIRANGTIIQGWYLHGGTWTQVLQHSDGFYQSGYGGFMVSQTAGVRGNIALDNFTSTMPAGGPVACNSCPDYVSYTGAAQQFSRIKHNVRLHARATVSTLDPGDVFKINAARTAYDWVDAAFLKGPSGPGWCGGSTTSGNWCGVVFVNPIPLPVNTYKQMQKSAQPVCSVDGWALTDTDNSIVYSGHIGCQGAQPLIIANNQLWAPLVMRHQVDKSCADCSQLVVGDIYICPTTIRSGSYTWHMQMRYNVVTPDAHVWPHGEPSPGFVLTATNRDRKCTP